MTKPMIPRIGANLKIKDLPDHIDWLLDGQRDLELFDASIGENLDNDWRALVRQANTILDGHTGRRGVHGPWDGLPLMCPDRRVRELVIYRIKQAIDFATDVRATQMVLHSPFEFYGSPMVNHTSAHGLDAEIALVHHVLDEILPLAQDAGCEMVLEVNYDTHTSPLIRLVESFGSPFVRLSLDTGHAVVMQTRGGPPAEQWVRDAAGYLAHVHVEDTDGLMDWHWAPGEGSVDWRRFFEAIHELALPPRLILEIKDVSKVRQGAQWLIERGYVT